MLPGTRQNSTMMRYRLTLFCFLAAFCSSAQESTDPRGPVVQAGIKPEVSSEGVYLAHHRFQPDRAAPPWQAPWIWLAPGTDAADAFVSTKGPVYEYACHEGNYAMTDILGGARKLELEGKQ